MTDRDTELGALAQAHPGARLVVQVDGRTRYHHLTRRGVLAAGRLLQESGPDAVAAITGPHCYMFEATDALRRVRELADDHGTGHRTVAAAIAELAQTALAQFRHHFRNEPCVSAKSVATTDAEPAVPGTLALVREASRTENEQPTEQAAMADVAFLAGCAFKYLAERGIQPHVAEFHGTCVHEHSVEVRSGFRPVLQAMACRSSPTSDDWEIAFTLISDRSRVGADWPLVSLPVGLSWSGAEPELRALVDRAIELSEQRKAA